LTIRERRDSSRLVLIRIVPIVNFLFKSRKCDRP